MIYPIIRPTVVGFFVYRHLGQSHNLLDGYLVMVKSHNFRYNQ